VTNPTGPQVVQQRARWLEDVGFVVGILLGIAYVGLVEILPTACYSLDVCQQAPVDHPFPWVLVAIIALCIAPKMIGRSTAGRVWEAIAARFGGGKKPE
jgi:hypothetical protein